MDWIDHISRWISIPALLIAIGLLARGIIELVDRYFFRWRQSIIDEARNNREVTAQVVSQLKELFDTAQVKLDWEKDKTQDALEALDTIKAEVVEYRDMLKRHRVVIRQLMHLLSEHDIDIPVDIDTLVVGEGL